LHGIAVVVITRYVREAIPVCRNSHCPDQRGDVFFMMT
jgi:hypothetical protein